MNFNDHIESLKALNLPFSDFVVVGSGALAVRGIREAKDLDVIATDSLWADLIKKYPVVLQNGIERIQFENDIEILNPNQSLFGNSEVVPVGEIFTEADIFDGIKFINLEHLKKIKLKLGREKDYQDIELIKEYERKYPRG